MRVWIIKGGESIPFEGTSARPMRAGLLAKMLSENGHDVTWWTSSVNHFSKTIYPQSSLKECFLPCGTKLIFLKSILYKKNLSIRRLINHFGTARQFKKLAPNSPKPDIVICSFPTVELSYSVVNFCKKENIPVLVDIRDLYPDVYITLFPRALRSMAKVLFYPMLWMTQKIMRQATGLIAISDTYLRWGLKHAKREQGKYDGVFPLAYPKSEVQISLDPQFTATFEKLVDKKLIFYVGSFVSSIDLETVIRAAKLLQEKNKDEFHFILSGDGGYKEQWKDMAKELQNVTFTGWVDSNQINWLASHSWVGLGAYKKNALMSLPNKIFEYMSFGLPILSSLEGETREFLEMNGCGLYYEAGNTESLVAHLEQLSQFPEERNRMGHASFKHYVDKYSPSRIYGNLIQHVEEICKATEKCSHKNVMPQP